MINKNDLIQQLLQILQQNLDVLIENAQHAKDAATNEESKAENKYDTRGLEASYLAGAQSKRAIELQEMMYRIKNLEIKSYNSKDFIQSTSIVGLKQNEIKSLYFFLLPVAGGIVLPNDIQTLAIHAPLAKALLGKQQGENFIFQQKQYEIVRVE